MSPFEAAIAPVRSACRNGHYTAAARRLPPLWALAGGIVGWFRAASASPPRFAIAVSLLVSLLTPMPSSRASSSR